MTQSHVNLLEDIVRELRQFVEERDWGQYHDPKNLAMLIASEAGELAAEQRWVANGDADAFTAEGAARARVESELADVAIAVLLFADRANIDLPRAIRQKIEVNRANYPAEEVRGEWGRPHSE